MPPRPVPDLVSLGSRATSEGAPTTGNVPLISLFEHRLPYFGASRSYVRCRKMAEVAGEAPIRVIAFFRRKPGLSDEEFYHHWKTSMVPYLRRGSSSMALKTIRKSEITWSCFYLLSMHILIPCQIQTRPALKSQWSSLLVPPLSNPLPTLPYDGYAEMQFSNPEKMRAAFLDPYYREVVEPDEWKCIEKAGGEYGSEPKSTMGYVKHIVLGGKNMVEGKKVVGEEKGE